MPFLSRRSPHSRSELRACLPLRWRGAAGAVVRAVLGILAASALTGAVAGPSFAQSPSGEPVTARVIVKFKFGSPLVARGAASTKAALVDRAAALSDRVALRLAAGPAISDESQVMLATGVTAQALAERLAAQSDVEYAVPDERRQGFTAPNDPLYAIGPPGNGPDVGQWYLRAPTATVQSSIDVEAAWAITTGSPDVVVAVLDSGVRFDHPDLAPHFLAGYDFVSDPDVANDDDGRDPDPTDPGDWVTQAELTQPAGPYYQCATAPHNSSWHGTQVSGLIAALTDNGAGMASVARNVRILPVRVLGKCGGFDSDIIAGMRWAVGLTVPGIPANPNPARILNLSLGSQGTCNAAYRQGLAQVLGAGAIVIAAAGNGAGHAVSAPANCPGVLAVGALRHVGTKVGFSNVGAEVAISAPGGNCINTAAGSPCLYPILTASNAGLTTPGVPAYTDSFKTSLGTSFSTPLVAGTVALMLSLQPTLTAQQVRSTLQSTARPFPAVVADTSTATIGQCTAPQVNASGTAVDQLECYCTTSTCGAGMLDAGAAVAVASKAASQASIQAEGLWWNAPAQSESGWGLNLAHQGDVIFATWFTYDLAGNAWWLSMTATKTGPNTYAGTLLESHGPAYNAVPFEPSRVSARAVGQGTIAFTATDAGTFTYTVDGVTQTKSITRQVFGALPTCTAATQDLALATNYQDLWWAAPAASELGWGLNIIEQSGIVFATWYTYDANGRPVWFSLRATPTDARTFTGTLNRLAGPPFNAVPFRPADVRLSTAGTASLAFADGNRGTFTYTVDGVTQSKAITRDVFRAPGTWCE